MEEKKRNSGFGKGLITGILISALACGAFFGFSGFGLIDRKGAEEYLYLKETYGFAEALKKVVKDQFYVPVEDEEALLSGMYKGLVAGLDDPYSEYLTEEEFKTLIDQLQGNYSGIGVTMSANEEDYIEVISVTDQSPAQKAGIRTKDLIIGVDGVTYTGGQMSAAAEKIRGEKDTMVKITILRGTEILEFEIQRDTLTDVTVYAEMKENNIGYLRISGFELNTGKDFAAELRKMEEAKVDGLIIDLRNNGGGVVSSAIEVADELMDAATVVYAENQKGEKTYYKTENGKTKLPYVLLVDGGSASAAEILAAGVQEYGGGLVVGSQTYGKGVIQTTQSLINGGALKLTTMQYYTSSGKAIQGVGMTPDIVVDLTWDDVDENGKVQDRQLEKAMELFEQAQ
ncbi:MAG: S41 family peptidase [Firmicutes bacterium]|nr:S41 family peptidase [Bacillota bacterium]MBQ5797750.1 S41 family peptidase [Bacillota bacterium]